MPSKLVLEDVAVERTMLANGTPRPLRILSGVNLAIPAGGCLALFGPSGSGKTSLLRVCNRLDDAAAGRVLLDGADLRTIDPLVLRRRIGMLFQQPFLFDDTVLANLAYPLRLQGKDLAGGQGEALLAEVGLPDEFLGRKGQELSGGQQQRVALARALALEPEMLLLDEPTSALDEESAQVIVDTLLRRNQQQGLTLMMITHSRDVLRRLACPVALVNAGAVRCFPDADAALGGAAHEKVEVD